MASPIFRWPGGKRRLVSTVLPLVERALAARPGAMYVEPFLGAGAVALAMPGRRMVLSDACPDLINAWRWVVRSPKALHELATEKLWMSTAREQYWKERERLRLHPASMEDAARFFYLNALAFNGIWRVNSSGAFNVPIGDGKSIAELAAFEAAAAAFSRATIHHAFANDIIRTELRRVAMPVIYADPPYDGGFEAYTAAGFGPEDQAALAGMLREAASRGAAVIASNADTERIRGLYEGWADLIPVVEGRVIAASPGKRRAAECLLITANVEEQVS